MGVRRRCVGIFAAVRGCAGQHSNDVFYAVLITPLERPPCRYGTIWVCSGPQTEPPCVRPGCLGRSACPPAEGRLRSIRLPRSDCLSPAASVRLPQSGYQMPTTPHSSDARAPEYQAEVVCGHGHGVFHPQVCRTPELHNVFHISHAPGGIGGAKLFVKGFVAGGSMGAVALVRSV